MDLRPVSVKGGDGGRTRTPGRRRLREGSEAAAGVEVGERAPAAREVRVGE